MSPLALFGLILLLSLGVMLVVMQPSKSERAVRERLRTIGSPYLATGQATTDLLKQDALSDVAWLNGLMIQARFFGALQRLLDQADSQRTVGTLFSGSLLLAVSATWVASIWTPTFALALIPGVAAGFVPYAYLHAMRARRFRRFEELLPDTIDLMTRALRAGHTITSGIEMVSQEVPEPVASEFRRVFEEQNFGLPLREAMLNLARRIPLPDVSFLVTAILVQKETGGNLAEILDKTTIVIRERFRLRGQLRVYTAQGRLTGWILVALPFFLFGVMTFLNPSYELVLIKDPTGQKLVYAGLIMMVLGVLVIRKVIDIKV
ncbi:MAG: type II secretion system F family protein [Acidobacteria bacterium]|nr:type II secretion system F family protein [Acidobacteriota bacterium]